MSTWLAFLLSCLTTPCVNLLWMQQALTAGAGPPQAGPDCTQCCERHCPAAACPQGTYFSSGLCAECPAGHFCSGNMSAPRKCPPATYNYYPGRSALEECQPCPSGSISTEDRTGCKPCPAGSSCDWLTGAVTLCLPGQHSSEGHAHCLPCSPGFVCADGYQRMCQPGEEPDTTQTECKPCPAGFYSTNGHCYPCPTGTYCPHPGTVLPLPCPPGQYSEHLGQRQYVQCNGTFRCGVGSPLPLTKSRAHLIQRSRVLTMCPAGTYRNSDEGLGCLLCPPGYYCTGGAAVLCPAGTYGPKDGLQKETDCVPCPAGFYCLAGSPKRPGSQFMCPQGYYCEEGTATPHGTPCPAGTAGSQLGQTSKVACKRCSEGRYCPVGSVFPGLPCARGRFCPGGTLVELTCPKGTFTPHQGAASVKDCLKCPAGFYCPEGTSDPLPCQPGTFNPLDGQDEASDCRACYPGKACTQAGLKVPDVDCLQGFFCPPGSSRPNAPANACPPGTLSERTDLADRSQCQLCPPRYACPRGTGGAQRPALPCFAGHYCPPGTMFPTQHKCPAGTWSQRSGLETEGECGLCPRGWYCLAGSGAPSGRCSSGHYCPDGTQFGSQFPCPAGTYSTRVGNAAKKDCLFCPEGAYCPPGTSKPTPCPPTTFRKEKRGQQLEECNMCPAGYFCPLSGTVHPSPCGAGSYSGEGAAICLPCQRGHYCSSATTSQEAMLSQMVCPAGLHCSQGLDREPQRSTTLCPKGFYCPGGSIEPNPIPCPNGTYSSQPGLRELKECAPCPAGLFCFSQQPWERPLIEPTGSCPDGYYCPVGTGEPHSHPCPAATYRNHSQGHRGELCAPCPPGHYCGSLATHAPTVCPQGFFCTKGSSTPTPCEEGTYGDRPGLQNALECTPCEGGKYCSGVGRTEPSGVCEVGFYCRGRARSASPAGGLCPMGSFCPPGSTLPTPCPPGTFNNNTGLGTPLQCVHCPPGSYCSGSNNTLPTGPCSPGYYCIGGSPSPIQYEAEEGHFTPAGAIRAEPCPFGTFQPARGQGSCLECPRGHLCNQTGLARPALCPPGHFCPAGSMLPHPCPPGSYLGQAGGESVQHCGPCDAGMFCRNPGLLAPQGPCSPGFYCLGGASTATPINSSSGDVCPVGYFCPLGNRHPRENPCPPGTWSNAVGARDLSSCWLCPAGFFCNGSALIQPSGLCAPGFYCSGGAKSARPVDGVTGNKCPVGYHCPQGSTSPLNCLDGSYSNTTGAAECLDCPPGMYCPSGVGVQPCPAGHYCLGGAGAEDVLPCPPGTYSPEPGRSQLEQCQLCPAGMYCEEWGQTEPTGPCQAGYFCVAGINFQNPDGNISTGLGGPCPQGHYCPTGTSLPVPCPVGHFSESLYLTEQSSCSPCPPGWFCGSVGLVRPSGPCQEGFYCTGRDSLSTGHGTGVEPATGLEPRLSAGVCPVAHYCPSGSAAPVPCPAGSYTNLTSQAHCFRCPAGYYCPERTSNFSHFPCPPGFYCPDGTRHATQFPCPRGYYNPEPMTQSLDSCLPCPPGHYCEKERLTTVSGKCKAGWFCVSAAWTSQPFDLDNYTNANCLCPATSTGGRCQEGFYCPCGSSEPHPCPAGAFCNASGLSQPTGPCFPGYYCVGGATRPKPMDGVTGNICPPGTYCGEGFREPELCPPGTFSSVPGLTSESHCQICTPGLYCESAGLLAPTGVCEAGYWCPPGQTTRTAIPCPVGHHCPLGSAGPVPCPVGSYQDHPNKAVCKPCEPGYYCDGGFGKRNTSSLQPCPKGHYCPPGTHFPSQYKCPPGTFNPNEGTDSINGCILCPPGKFCSAAGLNEPTGDCHAGFWCQEAAHTPSPLAGLSGGLCPTGHYCPKGTLIPLPCPVGTWSNSTGHKSIEECHPCPGGFYCSSAGLTVPTGPCSGGFYCLEKAGTPTPTDSVTGGPCPKQHYCPVGTAQPFLCQPGTFMDATQATQCQTCPPTMYCLAGTVNLCPAGFYCPENTGYDFKPCPEGSYSSDPGLTMASQCRQCDGGHFCSLRNATIPTGLCSAGYYCKRGNTSPEPHPHGAGLGGPCPAGHYCPSGTTDPEPCPEGTFNNLTKRGSPGDCLLCSLGHFCDRPGLTSPTGECWKGFYCQRGAVVPNAPIRDSRGGPCTLGHFCPKGAASPQPCPEGTISTQEGQSSCKICSQGYYCSRNSSSYEGKECPTGHFCPPGTSAMFENPCPEGTFNPHSGASSLQDCLACSPGHFCATRGLSAPSGPCAVGHFCQGGATSPTSEYGCPSGHYCPEGSASPKPCPPGQYSNTSGNVELSDCLPCPAGFSCEGWGLSAPSQPCQAGHYCPPGQTVGDPVSHRCSPGHMCPTGSATQIPCALGTYQDHPEQVECLPCPMGFFCAGLGSHTPTICPKGHYCPEGSSVGVALPCPLGTLGTQAGLSSPEGCEACPPGKYCGSLGLSAPTGDCSPGYLCIQGAVLPQPVEGATGGLCSPGFYCPKGTSHMLPCPPGTFNPLEGAASADTCMPCWPGNYCAGFGLDSPSGLCWPGHYCTLGARSPTPNITGIAAHVSNHTDNNFPLDQAGGDICPMGHYCPSGTSYPRPCSPGTFLGKYGAKSEKECDPCTPGFYCPEWGQRSADLKCPEGWYCPSGSGSTQQQDLHCKPGHACPSGSVTPSPCLSGSYQPMPGQPICRTCPPGFYCLEGSSEPVPCPVGTVGWTGGLQSPLACSLCPSGTYCRDSGLSLPSGPCTAGHYCTLGATEPTPVSRPFGDLCPAGHFCPSGSSVPLPCPAGTYLPERGAPSRTNCLPCPPGLYCNSTGSALPSGLCSPGHYCTGGASSAKPLAKTFQSGCFRDVAPLASGNEHVRRAWGYNKTALDDFPGIPGSSTLSGPTPQLLCNMEGGANEGMNTTTHWNSTAAESSGFQGDICPRGFYCPMGSAQPEPCEQGLYCDRVGLFAPAGPCATGYYCPRGSTDPQASLCPAGHYCPLGISYPVPCPLGTLRNSPGGSAEDECLPCPSGYFCAQRGLVSPSGVCAPGYFCPRGQLSARPQEHICRAGYHCGEGSPVEQPCSPGSYQATEGQKECKVCPSGYFCHEEAMTQPIPCQKGFFCPTGTATQQPCPPGSYGNHSGLTTATDCILCDPGMYCKGSGNISPTGLCKAGFLCFGGSSLSAPSDGVMGGQCPPGYYCPTGSSAPSPCLKGTFSEQAGLSEHSQCRSCSPGFYCSEPGLTAVSGPCLPGFFCLEGSESAIPVTGICSAGHYCEGGSAIPKPCPPGTHRAEEGGRNRDDCIPCPQDSFQDLEGQKNCKPCPPGYHCSASVQNLGSIITPLPCPVGHYCQTGLSPCPRGTYSSVQGLTSAEECLLCPEGYFCGSAGLLQPSGTCAPGFLCFAGAQEPKPTDNHTGMPCPRGAYCLLGVIGGECSPGFYCDWGSSGPEQSLCPQGFYCPRGTKSPMPCHPGTFGLQPGKKRQEDCILCPAGSVCEGKGVQPRVCPEGYFCPPGSAVGTSFPCPPGTMRPQPGAARLEDCHPCPAGMFCAQHGLTTPTGLCQAGYLCHPGASNPNATGLKVQSPDTDLCPPGHYCPAGTAYPRPCPPGSYSSIQGLGDAEQCQPCPPGHFCDHPGLVHISEAALCDAGYVCLEGSSTPRPLDGLQGYLCPSGFSCPVGTAVEVPCEPGSYSLAPGAAHCLPCPAGTACTSSGTKQPLPCPAGHYCLAGSSSLLLCPPGTMNQQTGAQDHSACVHCPPGLYCSSPGTSEPQGQCQHGYFCQGGATSSTPQSSPSFPRNGPCPSGHYCPIGTLSPLPCPTGSFLNVTGASSLDSCLPCLPGHYCASLGQHSPSGPCSAGFYCPPSFSSITPEALLCPKGHYCPEGSAIPLPCLAGTYQLHPGAVSCTPCPPRFYCPEMSMEEPKACPHHSYCSEATAVPTLCPNGTFTPLELGGLQVEGECLPCPPGRFCRLGRVQGLCAAGYICISGSSELAPQGLPLQNWSQCQGRLECSGLCPRGFYCPEGAVVPQVCPVNTVSVASGASSLQNCLPCPPKYWCREGDPSMHLCPPGHYCDGLSGADPQERAGPKECPFFTYRSTPGAFSKGDCHSCPPGFHCNSTGLLNFSSSPCPPGFWCSGKGPSVLCSAGTMRPEPGAATPDQCQPCTPGTYCPDPRFTGQPNIQGIPCRASFQCPTGAVTETPCRAGSFCGSMTGEPTECPSGYFCPEGSDTYNKAQQVCTFPHYCPSNSSEQRLCDGGFRPLNTSGLRTSKDGSCTPCEAGTYRLGLFLDLHCLPCPSGYYCPPGTEHYWIYVCPSGYVCPLGSSTPAPCPPGSYGSSSKAENPGECHPCPEDTFNHLPGQRACFPCGSSSFSLPGALSCTCIGQNRAFQHSDGSCLCRTGFVFYNKLDHRSSDVDSTMDCQPEVNERCGAGQVRMASTRRCVSPSLHLCNITCGTHGGVLDVELGICQCERYVSTEELCNASCMLRLPQVSAQFAADGQLQLKVRDRDEQHVHIRMLVDVLGPDVHINAIGNVQFAQFADDGVFGWILTDKELIDRLLSEPAKYLNRGSTRNMDTNGRDYHVSSPLPRIPNPIVCLSTNDMLIFKLSVNYSNRHLSHFPVYKKDHLFNSNPTWDFGMFRRLSYLIRHSQFNISWFAHVFSEPGTYVFLDNGVPDWGLIVVVNKLGIECDPRATVFQPSTPSQLVRHGVLWQRRLNLLPNWGTIAGILCFLVLLIVVLTASVLILESGQGRLVVLSKPKPRWRSLGEPSVPVGDACFHQGQDILRYRGAGEKAETEEQLVCRGGYKVGWLELEEFNVRTLYDKLEDQSLHLASQLSKFRKETQEFYRNMCQQADALRDLMENIDSETVNQIKDLLASNSSGNEELMGRGGSAKEEVADEPSLQVLGALLQAFGALLHRDNWETSLQDYLADVPLTASGTHTRSTQDFQGPLQLSMTNMSGCKPAQETRILPPSSVHLSDSAPCLSENDLAKLVALTPLSRTLQQIQESLQKFSPSERDLVDIPVEEPEGKLIPWALDNLSPQHLTVFLFGCDIVRQLCATCGFPRVTLLLAHTIPDSQNPGLVGPCIRDVHYDSVNQILYLHRAKLENVGHFTATILHSMAYIGSGFTQDFFQALYRAVSALGPVLFHACFSRSQDKTQEETASSLFDDFLGLKIPEETHFTEPLLAERLQKFKHYKFLQHLRLLKPQMTKDGVEEPGPVQGDRQAQMRSLEREIDRLDCMFLHLTACLQGGAEMRVWPEAQKHSGDKSSQAAMKAARSPTRTLLLSLKRRCVAQHLNEMHHRLSQIRLSQTGPDLICQSQPHSCMPGITRQDGHSLVTQMGGGNTADAQIIE